ncbi:hypothetical protein PIB30_044909 [Stylosanthes scabra]|uniref:Uncharacterized protein n=1 Tax=Stylosanthes scabra TaxID=79078 RepID=A0ABU6WGZ2_9FABA|nr:hypothetical protein [Stylosanthes scabra]
MRRRITISQGEREGKFLASYLSARSSSEVMLLDETPELSHGERGTATKRNESIAVGSFSLGIENGTAIGCEILGLQWSKLFSPYKSPFGPSKSLGLGPRMRNSTFNLLLFLLPEAHMRSRIRLVRAHKLDRGLLTKLPGTRAIARDSHAVA